MTHVSLRCPYSGRPRKCFASGRTDWMNAFPTILHLFFPELFLILSLDCNRLHRPLLLNRRPPPKSFSLTSSTSMAQDLENTVDPLPRLLWLFMFSSSFFLVHLQRVELVFSSIPVCFLSLFFVILGDSWRQRHCSIIPPPPASLPDATRNHGIAGSHVSSTPLPFFDSLLLPSPSPCFFQGEWGDSAWVGVVYIT